MNNSNEQNQKYISNAVIRRLPRYYRYLRELIRQGIMRISSRELSERMGVTASQIRQDLNCFGGFGQQGYGYNVKYLYNEISKILGVDCGYNAIIVGMGNLGHALSSNPLFEKRGVTIKGLFDIAPEVVGKEQTGLKVMHMDEISKFCKSNKIDIAVLTIPKSAAYDTAQLLYKNGIRAFWNFSNAEIKIEGADDVMMENVHLGDSLMALCYEVSSQKNTAE